MRIQLDISENLLNRALALLPGATIDEVLHDALMLYIAQDREKQMRILELAGEIEYDPEQDHKADRRAR